MNIFNYLKVALSPIHPSIPWRKKGWKGGMVTAKVDDTLPTVYPQVVGAEVGAKVTRPYYRRKSRDTKTGPTERRAKLTIVRHNLRLFFSDMELKAQGHRYVPDLLFIDEQHGVYIDVECDEPYTFTRNIPIHYIGENDERNRLIAAAGGPWSAFPSISSSPRRPRACGMSSTWRGKWLQTSPSPAACKMFRQWPRSRAGAMSDPRSWLMRIIVPAT